MGYLRLLRHIGNSMLITSNSLQSFLGMKHGRPIPLKHDPGDSLVRINDFFQPFFEYRLQCASGLCTSYTGHVSARISCTAMCTHKFGLSRRGECFMSKRVRKSKRILSCTNEAPKIVQTGLVPSWTSPQWTAKTALRTEQVHD